MIKRDSISEWNSGKLWLLGFGRALDWFFSQGFFAEPSSNLNNFEIYLTQNLVFCSSKYSVGTTSGQKQYLLVAAFSFA